MQTANISGGKERYAVAGPDGGTWWGNGSASAPGNGDMWTGNGSAVAGNVDEDEPFDHHSGLNPFSIGNRLEQGPDFYVFLKVKVNEFFSCMAFLLPFLYNM